jgi:hypothetical protein
MYIYIYSLHPPPQRLPFFLPSDFDAPALQRDERTLSAISTNSLLPEVLAAHQLAATAVEALVQHSASCVLHLHSDSTPVSEPEHVIAGIGFVLNE